MRDLSTGKWSLPFTLGQCSSSPFLQKNLIPFKTEEIKIVKEKTSTLHLKKLILLCKEMAILS